MNKFLKILNLSILAGCLLVAPTFATNGWPTEDTQVEVFDTQISETQERVNVFDSTPQSNQTDTINSTEMSPTDGSINTQVDKQQNFNTTIKDVKEVDYTDTTDLLPDVSIDDAVEWGQRKSYEIIHLMQTFVQPICVIAFIISAFLFLFGTVANNNLASQGLMGLFCSAIVYALVMFAPVIVQTFTAWVAS